MGSVRVRLPQSPRFGRNINHDPRSRRFPVRKAAPLRSVMHDRKVPVFDQGDLGACTGYAATGCMGTEPFFSTITPPMQAWGLDPEGAVDLYSRASALDSFPGSYPPDDTGSDGLSIAKALKDQRGWISGYEHAFSLDQFLGGLMVLPCIVGTEWTSGMMDPTPEGVIRPTGRAQGGHEYQAIGYDNTRALIWFVNSWGTGWARRGFHAMQAEDFGRLLERQGDVTFFTPLSEAAPTPAPDPDKVLASKLSSWARRDVPPNADERAAFRQWMSDKGLS